MYYVGNLPIEVLCVNARFPVARKSAKPKITQYERHVNTVKE